MLQGLVVSILLLSAPPETVSICSFNVQFLGMSEERDNVALALAVRNFDIVLVQEMIAPPEDGVYPDGTPYKGDPQTAKFFAAMKSVGFAWEISEENTGPNVNHVKSTSAEWFVAFFKPEKFLIAQDLPRGFLSKQLTKNPSWSRVPYAFSFRTMDGKLDFTLISVHFNPDEGPSGLAARKKEIAAAFDWIAAKRGSERDIFVVGDANIQSKRELDLVLPVGVTSLNSACLPTNTNINGPKPFDHAFCDKPALKNVDLTFPFKVVTLTPFGKVTWDKPTPFPGEPYSHDQFRKHYSDHNPVVFRLVVPAKDED